MKKIENIFSTTSPQKEIKCPNPKTPIVIDTREKQSLIAANLIEQKAKTKFEKLDIGDYLIQDTIIERKTFSDFVSSMINKRLIDQLKNLKKYPKYFLILEGFYYDYNKFEVHENAIRGMLASIAIDFQIPLIMTENENDTAKFLITIAKKYENKENKDHSTRPAKTTKTLEEEKLFILEGFPSIGPTTAKKMLKNFINLQEIFNATPERLEKTGKLEDKQIKKFREILED